MSKQIEFKIVGLEGDDKDFKEFSKYFKKEEQNKLNQNFLGYHEGYEKIDEINHIIYGVCNISVHKSMLKGGYYQMNSEDNKMKAITLEELTEKYKLSVICKSDSKELYYIKEGKLQEIE